uniref:Reverse transcriptase domain-containing protein n=1 Tax=Panagrolaimus sp. PS1159 TaxID=55785 RepID=A0AC35G4Z6_9BILA
MLSEMKEFYSKIINDPNKAGFSQKIGSKLFKFHQKFVKNQQKILLQKQRNLYDYVSKIVKQKFAPIPGITENGILITDDAQKAEGLLKYFHSVYNPKSPIEINSENDNDDGCISNISFSYVAVKKHLKSCSGKNLNGPDGIPGIILKKCSAVLAYPLSLLFQHMIDKCDVPDAFRISHVSAIPKIFNPTTYSHYRPISAMSEINKAADRVIREMIEKHLKLIKFLPDEQYGFRTGYSTTKQMVIFMEDIVKDINDGKTIDIIFIDMVKAFDTMTTAKIAEQLEKAKIRGKLLKLIICFLEHRRFLVKVNGVHSDTEEATSGAPQGGVLSAVLFIIFFQKLSEVLNEEEIKKFTKHYKFADDLKLKNSYFLEEFDRSHMQKALDLVSAWCNENSMSVNAAKTVHVQYGSKNSEAKFFINDTQIIQQNVTRDLGLYINNDLTLDTHVENISKTANGKMFSILRKVITNDPKILTQIFTTYIRPNYEYASSVFNISQRNTIIALEAIQKLFTRI